MRNIPILTLTLIILQASADKILWDQFKTHHGKNYASPIEERVRYSIFQKNLKLIENHNKLYTKGLSTYNMSMNKFGDLTKTEFLAMLNTSKSLMPKMLSKDVFRSPLNVKLPKMVDWRMNGSVTPIKDQGQCGSCWSFSATGSLEGQNQITNQKLISLSEQNLVDCSGMYGNYGCGGGLMTSAFEYVLENGIASEQVYPYEATDGDCRYDGEMSVLKIKGYKNIEEGNEEDLQAAVATVGPVAVAIDATFNLQFYSSGLFNDRSCSQYSFNHGVLAVGYGSIGENNYWLVKNSWGVSWGEEGYVKMSKNKNNQCGIASMATFPTL